MPGGPLSLLENPASSGIGRGPAPSDGPGEKSGVTGDCHAPFRGSPGVRFPRATRPGRAQVQALKRLAIAACAIPDMTIASRSVRRIDDPVERLEALSHIALRGELTLAE